MRKKGIDKIIVGKTKKQRALRHNVSKVRSFGRNINPCTRCGGRRGHISKYSLNVCRRCFREIAVKIGFKKYR